ncbi:unnamed protein product, partial [Effrenium voratum]
DAAEPQVEQEQEAVAEPQAPEQKAAPEKPQAKVPQARGARFSVAPSLRSLSLPEMPLCLPLEGFLPQEVIPEAPDFFNGGDVPMVDAMAHTWDRCFNDAK